MKNFFEKTHKFYSSLRGLNLKDPAVWLASWFGCGFIYPAPGTWGSIGAIPFAILIVIFGGTKLLLVASLIIFPIGLWASKKFGQQVKNHDSSAIVIDEVAGMWIALLPAGLNPVMYILGFMLFRFFDIVKPFPIGFVDKKIPNEWGVMLDDTIAGIASCLCLLLVRHFEIIS